MAYNKNSPSITVDDQQEGQRLLHALSPVDRPSPLRAVCPRPIPNSYWATPLLLACEYSWTPKNPNKPEPDALLVSERRVLSSRAVLLVIDPETIEYHRFPIRDWSLPKSVEIYRVLDVLSLRDNEKRGRISAVHCRGAIGRTGMVIGCWLVQSGLAKDGDEALEVIAKEWRTAEKFGSILVDNDDSGSGRFQFIRDGFC
ncbi:hypothetical protein K435DRAFT_843875 [Dendrothele bispora CBS 962.96]|uniref:Tyrosine specific protein phosphatases domain-containing protein n=1 Tax=Dendrothele bispora (strain CBS 962.96) TaxID=1314807 RepID=A0A4S8L5L3_DENBC|nr:hypothetical protein K435DRAFT_843875 [Dendrothele bispora CBS 962.96]